MYLQEININIAARVIIGIAAMLLLFGSFLIAFISSQRRKFENQKNMHAFLEQKQQMLTEQNYILEQKVIERTTELNLQKEALQQSLTELKNTQQQLIHHEKMASLGELTAGIAHEIQNPLNFINNFSEVTVEMFDELEAEMKAGNDAEATALEAEIKQNLQKINHHGKRASSIVKGMMQHSRTNSGKKEATNLNGLADECLHLSYQGLRGKDKTLNAKLNTVFASDLPDVQVNPQDIGRVIINLISNALYAVHEKKIKTGADDYEPTVTIATKKTKDFATITITDNGTGIAELEIEKIFQPFFTTKPTGQGTGLGLSMSYEIIKAHGGEIDLRTREGEFAEFIISLPLKP